MVQAKRSPTKTKLCIVEKKIFSTSSVFKFKLKLIKTKYKSSSSPFPLAKFQVLHWPHVASGCHVRWHRSRCSEKYKKRASSLTTEVTFMRPHVIMRCRRNPSSREVKTSARLRSKGVISLALGGLNNNIYCPLTWDWTQALEDWWAATNSSRTRAVEGVEEAAGMRGTAARGKGQGHCSLSSCELMR